MTRYLLDVADYQGPLKPADVERAGFTAVNLKVSHGLGRKSVHPDVAGWVDAARARRWGISTFHYLTAGVSGTEQAEYAYRQIADLGLASGTAHQVDVESDPAPDPAEVRAYLTTMAELLQRPVALYTGDWWWKPKGWNVSDLTPYLWAAPNAGYLGGYPGDTSAHWKAGYGGWPNLSIMQFTVGPLVFPGGERGTIDVSKSAIRTEQVWTDLTQGRRGVSFAPQTLRNARTLYIDTIVRAGYRIDPLSVGIVGDDSHANAGTSYHLGDDALRSDAYSIVESSRDRNGLTDAASALDCGWFSIKVGGKTHNLRTFSAWLVAECKAGAADTKDIREVIYSTDGTTVKRWDRLGIRSTGDSSHLTHTHISRFRDAENSNSILRLLTRYFTEIGALEGPDMTPEEMTAWARSTAGKEALALAVLTFDPGKDSAGNVKPGGIENIGSTAVENPTIGPNYALRQATVAAQVGYQIRDRVDAVARAVAAVMDNVAADDADKAEILAALTAAQAATVEGVLSGLGGSQQTDEEVAAALRAALGDRAAAVGALLAGA